MFASNFPVDAASYGDGILWNAFKRVAACYSFDEQRELFHDTAARVYRLPG
jgi:L-fuconolactonase